LAMEKIKILNLNIWNYNNFEERKPKIVKFIKKHNPDIITFQEIRDDVRFNKKGDNQAKQINRELGYKYYCFYSVSDKRKERPEKYQHECVEGSAILSKLPIIKVEKKKLKKHKDDIYSCGNLCVKIKAKKIIDIVVVHFSNSNYFSLLHLLETLKYVNDKKINPIIIGDFNMYESDVLNSLTEDKFVSSMKYKKYLSYPIKKWTLDYVLIPKKYRFKSFECSGNDLSDHKALVAEIEVK